MKMSEIKFSTTLNYFDLPSSCDIEFTIRDDGWSMKLKKIGSISYSSIHIADPIMDEITEKASQWNFKGIEYYEPHDRYSTVLSCYIGYLDLVKIVEKLEKRSNIYDFDGGDRFEKTS